MKTIGLIGGTSWVSTLDYYRLINELTNEKLGGVHAARLLLYSLNFGEIKELLDKNDWESITAIYTDVATKLKAAGADCIVLAANTPHLIADKIQKAAGVPLIHIAEATAKVIRDSGIQKVALLGTKFVMESNFFPDILAAHGIETIVPNEAERGFINESIFTELTRNIFTPETKRRYVELIDRLITTGASGIVYACTEIPILLQDISIPVKTFDTTLIHARSVVDFTMVE